MPPNVFTIAVVFCLVYYAAFSVLLMVSVEPAGVDQLAATDERGPLVSLNLERMQAIDLVFVWLEIAE